MTYWRTVALLLSVLAPPHSPAAGEWRLSGDVRAGYVYLERTARDGTETDDDHFRGRLRVAAERDLSASWRFRVRAAGRYGDDQDRFSAYFSPDVLHGRRRKSEIRQRCRSGHKSHHRG